MTVSSISSASHVVVVEDDSAIRRGVVDALRAMGYRVSEAADGANGQAAAVRVGVDLVLLDLLLPKRDGLSVLAEIRKVRPNLPVIILTARGTEDDRVRGLKLGADDYVVKPFSARELLARVEAVLRRCPARPLDVRAAVLGTGSSAATVDFARREIAWPSGRRTELSETETGLLRLLLCNASRAVSREEILTALWGVPAGADDTRTVDMHVARLRAKFRDGAGSDAPEPVVTVRSAGYMAAAEWRVEDMRS